jgi:hypothetical protein
MGAAGLDAAGAICGDAGDPGAVVPGAGAVVFCAAAEVGEMVMVRPSLLKLAMTGMVELTVMAAIPLLSV